MIKQVRNKDTICATVSPYTRRQVEELVKNKEFGSMSDLVGVAITEFLMKYNAPREPPTDLSEKDTTKKDPDKKRRTDIE